MRGARTVCSALVLTLVAVTVGAAGVVRARARRLEPPPRDAGRRRSSTPSTARRSRIPIAGSKHQSSPETRAWLAAQAAYADRMLPRDQLRQTLEARLAALMDRAEIGDAARAAAMPNTSRCGGPAKSSPQSTGGRPRRPGRGCRSRRPSATRSSSTAGAQPGPHDPGRADGGGSGGPLPHLRRPRRRPGRDDAADPRPGVRAGSGRCLSRRALQQRRAHRRRQRVLLQPALPADRRAHPQHAWRSEVATDP